MTLVNKYFYGNAALLMYFLPPGGWDWSSQEGMGSGAHMREGRGEGFFGGTVTHKRGLVTGLTKGEWNCGSPD